MILAGADPNELTNTFSSAAPTVAPRPELKTRLDALRGCHPDDLATPEESRARRRRADRSSWLTKT